MALLPFASAPSAGASIGGSVSGATSGSILYIDASGTLAQDNANFYWDGTNHTGGFGTTRSGAISATNPLIRIKGTGTSSSTSSFEVQDSAAATILFVRNDGRVGIGNSAPTQALHVGGATNYCTITSGGILTFKGAGVYQIDTNTYAFQSSQVPLAGIYFSGTTNAFEFRNLSGVAELVVDGTGSGKVYSVRNFSVGTTNGTSTFNVGSGTSSQFQIDSTGKILQYRNVATTAGWGVPAIYAAGRAAAQTAANASVSTYTNGAADGSFEVSANVLVTTSSAENFTVTCAYTDEGNTARTLTLNFQTIAGVIGTAINFANGAVPYEGILTHIRAKASTTITIATTGTFTGVTYNAEGIIKQMA